MKRGLLLSLFVILIIIVLVGGFYYLIQEDESDDLLLYEDSDLGISFNYPTDFKVHKVSYINPFLQSLGDFQSTDVIIIESNYEFTRELSSLQENSFINRNINISIMRESHRKSVEEIEKFFSNLINVFASVPQAKYKIISVEKIHDHELVKFERGDLPGNYCYYVLSDKGTFRISDNIDENSLKTLKEKGVYQDYRTEFDKIVNSIRII